MPTLVTVTAASSGTTRVTVEVTERETVVARGHQRTSWLVRDGRRWGPVGSAPGASVTLHDPPPGTVWERSIELRVAPGTLLMRLESRPAPARRRDPLEHLQRETRLPPRVVQRRIFAVDRRGALVPQATEGTPADPGRNGAPSR